MKEPDDDEGPGLGLWVSACVWLILILAVIWTYFLWRNHL